MSNYKITTRAYTKMILHAAKYPHCAINGILLSTGKGNGGSGNLIEIVDAIPLFHQCLHVSPMSEIALVQIEAMANKSDLQIAGYYAACELFNDNTIERAPGSKIADKIAENYPHACFAIIDNATISTPILGPALHLWQNNDGRWATTKFSLEQSADTLDAVKTLLERGAMKEIYDFDNHLDNIQNDWTNKHLNIDLNKLLAMY